MPLFNYLAIDQAGKKRSGIVDALSEADAKRKLREQGIMVTTLSLKKGSKFRENLRGDNLVTFTLQLSQLISSGIPIYESLLALEEQYRGESYHRVVLSLCEKIKGGSSLSQAMGDFPGSFSRLYCAMVAAGESAGALDVVLERLSQFLAKQDKIRKEVRGALIYPAILGVFTLLVIAMLLGYVVPSLEGIFEGRELNPYTQFIINLSNLFRTYWWLYLPVIALLLGGFVYFAKSTKGKMEIERWLMKTPLVKNLMIQASMARFCRTMGTLQEGGLNMIESLHISREVMGNLLLENEIKQAELKIMEGSSLSSELSHSRYIPPLVSRMVAVAEETGTTAIILQKLADMYENNLEKTINRLLTLAQPVILIIMGIVVGSVIFSILLPLTNMSTLLT